MKSVGTRLLRSHVQRFNASVRDGDLGPMLAQFADEAELVFRGVSAGPFRGRRAIETAYREQPPDDEIVLLGLDEIEETVRAGFAWSRGGTGTMQLTHEHGEIVKLVVTFDQEG